MTKRFRWMVVLLAIACMVFSGCSAAAEQATSTETITEVDGLGRSVTINVPVNKVVTLAPANTEIMFAIGAGEKVAGRDGYSDYPEESLDIQSVGGPYTDVNNEMIVSLDPDLVLASGLTPSEQVQAMQDLGLTVYVIPNPTSLEDLYSNIRMIARFTGNQEQAENVIEDFTKRVADVEAIIEGVDSSPLVYYEIDGTDPNAPWLPGPGTFIDTLISMAGGKNLGAAYSDPWIQLSGEEIIAQNPDIILLGDSIFGMTVEDVAARPGWDTIKAVQDGKVFPFDDNLVSRPGPRLVEGLEELAKIIHAESFGK